MYSKLLIKKYYEEHPITRPQLDSFNWLIDHGLKRIIQEVGKVEFEVTPEGVKEAYLVAVDIEVGKAQIIDIQGPRIIYPYEARLRQLTYSAPVRVRFQYYEDGELKEDRWVKIGELPVMVRSKICNTYGLSEEELLKVYEDPLDPGGYFIINGVDRVIVMEENLAPNQFYVQENNGEYVGKMLSVRGGRKIPITIELKKDGILYLTFSRLENVPLIPFVKVLGIKDNEIAQYLGNYEETFINLLEFADQDYESIILGKIKIPGLTKEEKQAKYERLYEIVDNYLLPHIGYDPSLRRLKAINLLKYASKLLKLAHGEIKEDDRDHYMNKRILMAGDLVGELFRSAFYAQLQNLKYIYQRNAKRKKITSIEEFVSVDVFNQRIETAFATGQWVGGKTGISQLLDRTNYLATVWALNRVTTSLEEENEMIEARRTHGTHWGRLDPIDTPEDKSIGLRKALTLLSKITVDIEEEKILPIIKELGAKLEYERNS